MPFQGDTSLGQGNRQFQSTIWECLDVLKGDDANASRSAFDQIVRWYWRPVYRCVRMGWSKTNDEAKDITQSFFVTMLNRDAFAKADPGRGKFRTFLKTALRNFIVNEHRTSQAIRRGGEFTILPHDFQEDPPNLKAAPNASPEAVLDAEWARTLLSTAIDRLRAEMTGPRETKFRMFEACDLHGAESSTPTYSELAQRFSVSEGEVKRALQETRARLRDFVVEEIRRYVRDEAEVWEELESLMGLWS